MRCIYLIDFVYLPKQMRKMKSVFLISTLLFVCLVDDICGAPSARPLLLAAETALNVTENDLYDDEVAVKYDGAQLWRVDFADDKTKEIVSSLRNEYDVSLWNSDGSSVDVFLKPSAVADAGRTLQLNNVSYSVVIDDYQKQIDAENPKLDEIEYQDRAARYNRLWRGYKLPPHMPHRALQRLKGALMGYNALDIPMEHWPVAKWGHRLTWSAYHRIADIYGFIDYLAKTYPDICSLMTIGNSVENRPLKVLRVSNGKRNPAIWVDGGIHAREWISPASVTYILNDLVENWDTQPAYIKNINWYFQPVVNPDGYEYTHRADRLWRKNRSGSGRCAGVDLNRNFGFHWGGKGTSNRPCSEIYGGPHAFSEPESAAQKRFFEQTTEKFHAFLTFHSYGQYILYPWGYDVVLPPDHQDLDRVGKNGANEMRRVGQQVYSVGPSGSLLYPAAGASDDWAKSLGIKYTYTVELRDGGRYGFVLPASFIQPTAKEAFQFVRTVAQVVSTRRV